MSPEESKLIQLEKIIAELERSVMGDEALRVKSLRYEIEILAEIVAQIGEFMNRIKWVVTIVLGLGGIQFIDLVGSLLSSIAK
jgi:hypothetical protein